MGKQLPNKADKFTNFSWWPAVLARLFFIPFCVSTNYDSYQIHIAPKRIILTLAKDKYLSVFVCGQETDSAQIFCYGWD